MVNVYENCPAFENDKYLLRFSSIDDAKDSQLCKITYLTPDC